MEGVSHFLVMLSLLKPLKILAVMRGASTVGLLVPSILIPALEGRAATYHVNAAIGHDDQTAEAAQSTETPWASIQKASDNAAPGDTIHMHAAIYRERVAISTNGTEGSGRITYLAEHGVTVRGFDITSNFNRIIGFEIAHPSNLSHEGIRLCPRRCHSGPVSRGRHDPGIFQVPVFHIDRKCHAEQGRQTSKMNRLLVSQPGG